MLKLGTWQAYKPKVYATRKDMARAYAQYAYNDGVKQAGWPGYIVVRNPSGTWEKPLNIYYYVNEPSTSYLAKYKITNNGLREM